MRCNLLYSSMDMTRAGVRMMISQVLKDEIVVMKRIEDIILCSNLVLEKESVPISLCVLQVGSDKQTKRQLCDSLD